tara:strand:+ start:49 stop:900 length:852 start_codon:yes stop_codon:yes gene_type:complete
LTVEIYDDLIESDLQQEVYDYIQTRSWYSRWIGATDQLMNDDYTDKEYHIKYNIKGINEYIPSRDGKFGHRHSIVSTSGFDDSKDRFSMYRHPFGISDEQIRGRSPLIYKLWTDINSKLFDSKATLDGIGERIGGLLFQRKFVFKDNLDFYRKYTLPLNTQGFTCYLNGRCYNPFSGDKLKGRTGQIHKDTGPHDSDHEYYTVLYVANLTWLPTWGGELVYYGEEDTTEKHWKDGYNVGWPKHMIGNRPNRIVKYSHDETHMSLNPRADAPEMSQRVAFRVKI